MVVNFDGISPNTHTFRGLSMPPEIINPGENEQGGFDHGEPLISDSDLVEVPVELAEGGFHLENGVLVESQMSVISPENGAIPRDKICGDTNFLSFKNVNENHAEVGFHPEDGVLMENLVSVASPENDAIPQPPLLEPLLKRKTGRRTRPLTAAKPFSVSSIAFKLERICEDPVEYSLEVGAPSLTKEMNEGQLPVHNLLEGWTLEIRKRSNGVKDKYYHHPSFSKKCRSKAEVLRLVLKSYDPQVAQWPKNQRPEELHLNSPESSSLNKKRKNVGFQSKLRSKKGKSSIADRKGNEGCQGKKSNQRKFSSIADNEKVRKVRAKELLEEAYKNLQSMSTSGPVEETARKESVERFYAEAEENLDNYFQDGKSGNLQSSLNNSKEESAQDGKSDNIQSSIDNFEEGSAEMIKNENGNLQSSLNYSNKESAEMINEMIEELLDKDSYIALNEQEHNAGQDLSQVEIDVVSSVADDLALVDIVNAALD